MIHKGYVCEIAYDPAAATWLDAWVWPHEKKPVPISFFSGDGEKRIGFITPVRWWRHSVCKQGSVSKDVARICFTIRHERSPEKRMGDFCDSMHSVKFEVRNGFPVAATIERDR